LSFAAADNSANLRHIEVFQFTVEGVHHQPLGHGPDERRGAIDQLLPEFHDTLDRNSIRQHRAGIDCGVVSLTVRGSERSNGIEILQS
jgi:hypothetical protein